MVAPAVPVIIGSIIGGLTASVSAIGTFIDSPIMAYFVVLGVLALDSGQASLFGNSGAVGSLLSYVISTLTGFNLVIESWYLLFIFAIFPFLVWFLVNSRR